MSAICRPLGVNIEYHLASVQARDLLPFGGMPLLSVEGPVFGACESEPVGVE